MELQRPQGSRPTRRVRALAVPLAVPRDRSWRLLAALLLAAATCLVLTQAARAQGEVTVDDGGDVLDLRAGRGMAATNARVAPLLASYPGQYAVICVAGCIGKPHVVQLLPRPVAARTARNVPSSAKIGDEMFGPPRPGPMLANTDEPNDVVCVAGCIGRPGQVLQRINDLPAPGRAKGGAAKRRAKKYEPLEIFP